MCSTTTSRLCRGCIRSRAAARAGRRALAPARQCFFFLAFGALRVTFAFVVFETLRESCATTVSSTLSFCDLLLARSFSAAFESLILTLPVVLGRIEKDFE